MVSKPTSKNSSKPKVKAIALPQKAHRVVDLPLMIGTGRTLFSDDPNDNRMRMGFQYSETEKKLLASVFFNEVTLGPPGHVHGGVLCFAMDEAMGTTAWAEMYPVVAGQLHLSFLAMVPVGQEYQIVVEIEKVEARRVHLHGQIQREGKVHLDAQGVFVRLLREQVDALVKINPKLNEISLHQMRWPEPKT